MIYLQNRIIKKDVFFIIKIIMKYSYFMNCFGLKVLIKLLLDKKLNE